MHMLEILFIKLQDYAIDYKICFQRNDLHRIKNNSATRLSQHGSGLEKGLLIKKVVEKGAPGNPAENGGRREQRES